LLLKNESNENLTARIKKKIEGLKTLATIYICFEQEHVKNLVNP